jgi:hypothetical protein
MVEGRKVKVSLSLDPRSVALLEKYSGELHLSRSAFVDLMVTQIDQVLRVSGEEEEKREATESGED